jgi:hypothetical protein
MDMTLAIMNRLLSCVVTIQNLSFRRVQSRSKCVQDTRHPDLLLWFSTFLPPIYSAPDNSLAHLLSLETDADSQNTVSTFYFLSFTLTFGLGGSSSVLLSYCWYGFGRATLLHPSSGSLKDSKLFQSGLGS